MDTAVVVVGGVERAITAKELATERRGHSRSYADGIFLCPSCKQAVYLADGKVRVPHFKHKRNNWLAKQCDLFLSIGADSSSQYQRVPPPLFIRTKMGRGKQGSMIFVVELGLKRIGDDQLAELEREGTRLVLPDAAGRKREYAITDERFGVGMLRLPIRLFLSTPLSVRLESSSRPFEDVWGKPRPIGDFVFFRCPGESLAGRCVEKWGTVALGEQLLVVGNETTPGLEKAFPDLERVGAMDASPGESGAVVYLATVSEAADRFLERHEINLAPADDTPTLLWPPSLTSDGAAVPLFAKSNLLYAVKTAIGLDSEQGGKLYIHSRTDSKRSGYSVLQETLSDAYKTASVEPGPDVRFLSRSGPLLSNSILLGFDENELFGRLQEIEEASVNFSDDGGWLEVAARAPIVVRVLRRSGAFELRRLDACESTRIAVKKSDVVRVCIKPALKLHGNRVIYELAPHESSAVDRGSAPGQLAIKRPPGLAHDRYLAEERAAAIRLKPRPDDVRFAMLRKASR